MMSDKKQTTVTVAAVPDSLVGDMVRRMEGVTDPESALYENYVRFVGDGKPMSREEFDAMGGGE